MPSESMVHWQVGIIMIRDKPVAFADSPPAGLVRTKPRCTLQALDVAIEEA